MNSTSHKNNTIKKSLKTGLLFLMLVLGSYYAKAQQNSSVKINLGLIYPLSTNGVHAPLDTNDFSFHAIAGVSAEERGVSFAGFTSVVRNNTHGTQFAGFSNHIGKKAEGVLFAGFANTYHENEGVAFAGFSNIAHGNVNGAQFAGFSNVAKQVTGVQFAGFTNVATKVKGTQFAGFLNVATNVSDSQLAGFINKAKDVKGSQIAGFINVARKVTGSQIAGFVNVADSSDYPIGILNFIRNGEKSIGFSIDENKTNMLTFRSGGRALYGIVAAGYNFENDDEVYAFEAGFGAHFFQSSHFRINAELTATTLESFHDGEYFKGSFKLFPAVKLGKHIEFFGGPTLNFITTNTVEGQLLHRKTLRTWQNEWSDFTQYLTLGFGGGVHIIF